jgi:hypothetical protein
MICTYEHAFRTEYKGGFDVVLGNPPWGAQFSKIELDYLDNLFPSVSKTRDSYLYFILSAINKLKNRGLFSFIVPNTWLLINSAKEFRAYILQQNIIEISDFGDKVFSDATVESMIITIKGNNSSRFSVTTKRFKNFQLLFSGFTDTNIWLKDEFCRINIELTNEIYNFVDKISSKSILFKEVAEIIWGIKPYQVGHGNPVQSKEMQENRIYHSDLKIDDTWKPLLVGSNINRYVLNANKIQFIKYGANLMYPSNEQKMLKPKILLRQTSDILRACFDDKSFYAQNSLFIITSKVLNLKALTLVLNSKLMNYLYNIYNPQQGKIFAEIKPSVIKNLPVSLLIKENDILFAGKAELMLSLNKKLQTEKQNFINTLKEEKHLQKITKASENFNELDFEGLKKEIGKQKARFALGQETNEWREYFNTVKQKVNELQSLINQTDKEIDRMVYELYELTPEEIEIVENVVK